MATGLVSAGDVFNNWTVLCSAERDAQKREQFKCKCVCGTTRVVRKCNLGHVQGCGCDRKAYESTGKYAGTKKSIKRKPMSIRANEKPTTLPKPQKDLANTIDVPAYQPPRTNRARLESILEQQRLAREIKDPWG